MGVMRCSRLVRSCLRGQTQSTTLGRRRCLLETKEKSEKMNATYHFARREARPPPGRRIRRPTIITLPPDPIIQLRRRIVRVNDVRRLVWHGRRRWRSIIGMGVSGRRGSNVRRPDGSCGQMNGGTYRWWSVVGRWRVLSLGRRHGVGVPVGILSGIPRVRGISVR